MQLNQLKGIAMSSKKNISLYITEQSLDIIAPAKIFGGDKTDQSKRINFIINAYADLLESPTLSYEEWMVIVASANGLSINYDLNLKDILYRFANDIVYAQIFGSEFNKIDKEDLARKFFALPIHQQLFAFEVARKFWNNDGTQLNSYREFLEQHSAKIE